MTVLDSVYFLSAHQKTINRQGPNEFREIVSIY